MDQTNIKDFLAEIAPVLRKYDIISISAAFCMENGACAIAGIGSDREDPQTGFRRSILCQSLKTASELLGGDVIYSNMG